MSYEKINFKNREVEKPLTFKKHVNDDGTITLEPKPGTIVEPGTPLLADHFNHMDDGIYKAHEEIDNLKLSGIERNKELVANLNSKKVSATTNDSLKTNIAKVKDIKLGSGNAVASDVLQGKTFSSSSGTDLTGTMSNNGVLSKTITTQGGKQIITPGYYEGGEVKAQFNNLVPENIAKGIEVGGVIGSYMPKPKLIEHSFVSMDEISIIGERPPRLILSLPKDFIFYTAQGKIKFYQKFSDLRYGDMLIGDEPNRTSTIYSRIINDSYNSITIQQISIIGTDDPMKFKTILTGIRDRQEWTDRGSFTLKEGTDLHKLGIYLYVGYSDSHAAHATVSVKPFSYKI